MVRKGRRRTANCFIIITALCVAGTASAQVLPSQTALREVSLDLSESLEEFRQLNGARQSGDVNAEAYAQRCRPMADRIEDARDWANVLVRQTLDAIGQLPVVNGSVQMTREQNTTYRMSVALGKQAKATLDAVTAGCLNRNLPEGLALKMVDLYDGLAEVYANMIEILDLLP